MFNGDIDLSVIMTFVSTICSLCLYLQSYLIFYTRYFFLVLMPAWLYSVGRIYTNATNIYIPFLRLLANLFTTIGINNLPN